MSTKTLRKRIALVAVSALGLGLMSVVPAQASNSYTSNITLSTTSMTVISSATGTNANSGKFYVDLTSTDTTTALSIAAGLRSDESITVSVIAVPTENQGTVAASDALTDVYVTALTKASTKGASFTDLVDGVADSSSLSVPQGQLAYTAFDSGNGSYSSTTDGTLNDEDNRYWFGVYSNGTNALNEGFYTIRVRLYTAIGGTVDKTIQVKFVTDKADSGAALTVAKSGVITSGSAFAWTANTSMSATLTNGVAGGRLIQGGAITAGPATFDPALTARVVDADGVLGESFTIDDSGTTGEDYVASTTAGAAVGTPTITRAIAETLTHEGNGTYGIFRTGTGSTAASLTNVIRVSMTGTNATADLAVTFVLANTVARTAALVTMTAAGISAANKLERAVSSTGTISYTVPSGTKTLTVDIATNGASTSESGKAYTSTITWGGNYATSNVTPATTTALTSYVGADGVVSRTLTNSSPVAGATASIALTGFSAGGAVTVSITWADPAPTTVTVLDPAPGIYAKLKAATVFTFGVYDQFGNAMAGQVVQPTVSGTTGNNPLGTTTQATVTTGATGTGTFTLTDALAADAGIDTVTFTTITGGVSSSAYTLTYKTTLPAVGIMNEFYSQTFIANTVATVNIAVPATGIATAAPVTLVAVRDLSNSLSANDNSATDDMMAVRVRGLTTAGAPATGAPVTLTAGTGAHIVGANGLPTSTRTVAIDANGDAYFSILATATGRVTWTVTSGTMTDTIALSVATAAYGTGRTVAISGATTGTANGAGIPMTVTVKDRYGNSVTGVTLAVTATGVGAFMGGATSQSYTTDSTGTFTFLATSYSNAGGAATFTARATNATDALSPAGYVGTSAVDSTLAAGVATASATVTFADGVNAAEANAQAATDAAAEATDAANAATDAANAAAEAADAATAAAQDAADAVAALSAQVATLISGLKSQLTALTNLVIKIQKKVKA
jgi:hypothetical protein